MKDNAKALAILAALGIDADTLRDALGVESKEKPAAKGARKVRIGKGPEKATPATHPWSAAMSGWYAGVKAGDHGAARDAIRSVSPDVARDWLAHLLRARREKGPATYKGLIVNVADRAILG